MARRRRREGSYEFWARALESLSSGVEQVVADAYSVWAEAVGALRNASSRLLAGGGLHSLILSGGLREAYEWATRARAVGIDSSRTRPVRLGFRYVSLVSGAAVLLEGEGRVVYMDVRPVLLPEEARHEGFRLELDLEMFSLEASALEAAAGLGGPLVFLDGPIVDPPGSYPEAERVGLAEKYRRYVERRSQAILEVLESGGLAVGYVKRLRGRMITEWASGELGDPEWAESVNDHFLGVLLSHAFRGPVTRQICSSTGMILATRPLELDDSRARDYPLYREQGLRVYTSLVVPGYCRGNHKPARIEVAVPEQGDPGDYVLRAAAAVEAWLLEGAWLPSPVLAAHKACTIRSRESLRMLREAGSMYARSMIEMLGEEDAEAVEGLLGVFD